MYYNKDPKEIFKELHTSQKGLTTKEATERIKHYGPNEIKKKKEFTALKILMAQFANAFLLLLMLAGAISLVLGEKIEAIAIFFILFLNVILGFIQEYRAEQAMKALEKLATPTAKLIRSNKEIEIPSKEIVPGDIIVLESGDIIPADARLIDVASLHVDEAPLTGESVPSKKYTNAIKSNAVVADQHNMVFMGTSATYGKATAVVTSTGMNTEFGKIAKSLQETKEQQTPLQKKFSQMAKQIGIVSFFLIIIVLVTGILRGTQTIWDMMLFALALTVSTIPNSLPIIVTIGLSTGSKRLAKKNMLIKKLPAAESLGAATIICSDKTGTITKNQMTVTKLYSNDQVIDVSGTGYEPKGEFTINDKKSDQKKIELLLRIGYLCNSAKLTKKDNKFSIIGDPTEGSLIVLGKKSDHIIHFDNEYKKIDELPFDSDRKTMSVVFQNKKKKEAYVKGAPDLLLEKCNRMLVNGKIKKLTKKDKEKFLKTNNAFAEDALRVLGFAYKDVSSLKKYDIKTVEKDLIFVGLVGMIDPPHDEVKDAVTKCNQAGIKVMIITGDHALTTKAIAKQIGLFKPNDIMLTGAEVEKMSDKELEKKIDNVKIIARALPIEKLKVVSALQKKGHIVAMTGDGVNDAPAVKKADIGIAMGITGTDVAKHVSKAVLQDDNFATIVRAIEEGRNIYDKMIKSAKYLLSCNAGEIVSVFVAIMLGFPLPLLPLMLLVMSILTDDFPALGLGFESSEEGIMKRKPRNPKAKPITGQIFYSIVFFGLIMGLGTFFMFTKALDFDQTIDKEIEIKDPGLHSKQEGEVQTLHFYYQGSYNQFEKENPLTGIKETDLVIKSKKETLNSLPRTIAFTTIVLFQMFAVLSSRSLHHSLRKLNPFSNMWLFGAVIVSMLIQVAVIYLPPLQLVFGTIGISWMHWVMIIGISSLGFVMMEVSKLFGNIKNKPIRH